MLARHREEDAKTVEPTLRTKEEKRVERLQRDALQLRDWLANNPEDRRGAKRKSRKASVRTSNRTDNNSAKMATSKGVIQGYTGDLDLRHNETQFRGAFLPEKERDSTQSVSRNLQKTRPMKLTARLSYRPGNSP